MGFGYGAQAEPVITDLSIDIASGDHLAIVGPSGIGKSSLAGLLAGMLRPTAGEILLDGVPMALYPAAALTRLRVLIPQEAYVFAGTLAENIRTSAAPPTRCPGLRSMPPPTRSASVPWCHGWADTTRSSTRPPFPRVNDSSSQSRGPTYRPRRSPSSTKPAATWTRPPRRAPKPPSRAGPAR